jgi:uncharacterized protein (TIGR00290 family)
MLDRIALAWSSGKDSTWALYQLQQNPQYEVVVLLTTLNSKFHRVTMHGVPAQLLVRQAAAVGLPLHQVLLPWPCSNGIYENAMAEACAQLINKFQVTHIAFGDLYLEDVRAYRERSLEGSGLSPVFPLWGSSSTLLAREMINDGLQAKLSCVDLSRLPAQLAGKNFDHDFLDALPKNIDPCGENGEFHTFVSSAPPFSKTIAVKVNGIVEREGFVFADLITADAKPNNRTGVNIDTGSDISPKY